MVEGTKKTILIVDDHSDIAISISNYLEFNGFKTFQAYGGESAIKLCNKEKPDLILMDIAMPKMSGIEVAKKLPTYKVLFFTVYDDLAEESKKVKNSIGIIRKPVDLEEMVTKIRKHFKLPKK
ncbi:response regulator [Candidatus Woesearchaeota archaeon]|jgi:two-component system, response regulator, stage 0 sporulation protein F|nr:response regulator [Candidatus Woesearchaeota archaeon]MBT4321752.1 response regulator [Candidatus Woesearchaeota archaeon]MBT4631156.1 response regulator [Candidatus Woesearchaeota archaeon]